MNVLIVFAHPERHSFNGALKNTAVETLQQAGHSVVVSDLYEMGWQAAIGSDDFCGKRADANYLDLSREQEHAVAADSLAMEIKAEQEKLANADLILFHFPVWWFSMPAIMKGWVDRVFARGFAYSAGKKYGTGHFQGKKAMLCITTGTAATLYEPNGIDGDLHHILWPIHNGMLAYTGFTVLPPYAAWMPARLSEEERLGYLKGYSHHLQQMDQLQPLYFHPWDDYDESQRLKPGVIAKSGVQWNPRASQSKAEASEQFTPSHK